MKPNKAFLAASTLLGALALALPATAQQAAPAPPAQPTIGTTTVTAADTATAPTSEPPVVEPQEVDTVTVDRGIRPNRPLLFTGGFLLIATYVPTAIIANSEGRSVEDSNLLIPVVGPWMNIADRRCDGCDNETRNIALAMASGVLQGVGAGMTILSFFVPEKVAAATIQAGSLKLQIGPSQVGRTGMGLGTVGVF